MSGSETSDWRFQIASDVVRDGLGIELVLPNGEVVAEVFRCDANHTISVSTFGNDVPFSGIVRLLSRARHELGTEFEDGTPIQWSELEYSRT